MGLLFNLNMDTTQRTLKMASETITQYLQQVDDLCKLKITHPRYAEQLNNGDKLFAELREKLAFGRGLPYAEAPFGFSFTEGVEVLDKLCERFQNIKYTNGDVVPKLSNHIYKICELFNRDVLVFSYIGPRIDTQLFSYHLNIPIYHFSEFQTWPNESTYPRDCTSTLLINIDAIIQSSKPHLYHFFDIVACAKQTLETTDDFDFISAWLLRTGIESNPGPFFFMLQMRETIATAHLNHHAKRRRD